jgi:hypothetical protein
MIPLFLNPNFNAIWRAQFNELWGFQAQNQLMEYGGLNIVCLVSYSDRLDFKYQSTTIQKNKHEGND